MKLINNNISPLPFYNDVKRQHRYKNYAYGDVRPLISYNSYILPFQFYSEISITELANVKAYLYNVSNKKVANITSTLIPLLKIDTFDWGMRVSYDGKMPIESIVPNGQYYIEIYDEPNNVSYYSDVFCAKDNIKDCIELVYRSTQTIKMANGIDISFADNFMFKCYLQAQIGKPDYQFEEEVTERLGFSFIESQVSKKIYKFTFIAPEYLCDALRIVRLCDQKRIIADGEIYTPLAFNIEVNWEEQGDLASVNCTFETNTVITNFGGYASSAEIESGKDFNEDFNEDYL